MTTSQSNLAELKRMAGAFAADLVESNTVVGLGVGSTVVYTLERLAERLREGDLHGIIGVPCGLSTAEHASALAIPLSNLNDHPAIDLTIDGADEVDPHFNLIKGAGGALLHEKIVAQASRREIIIVDAAKLSPSLGTTRAVPVEVVPFGHQAARAFLETLGGRPSLRVHSGEPLRTEEGNFIYDTVFGPIADPAGLGCRLEAHAAIAGHGLFVGIATDIVVADEGGVRHMQRPS